MNITVTVTLAPEVLSILETFAKAISGNSAKEEARETKPAKVKVPVADIIKAENGGSQPKAAETKAPEKITIEQVRDAVQKKAQAGKKDEIKALPSEFGVKNVTGLSADQYADFLARIKEIPVKELENEEA